jgi:hypothetical protein
MILIGRHAAFDSPGDNPINIEGQEQVAAFVAFLKEGKLIRPNPTILTGWTKRCQSAGEQIAEGFDTVAIVNEAFGDESSDVTRACKLIREQPNNQDLIIITHNNKLIKILWTFFPQDMLELALRHPVEPVIGFGHFWQIDLEANHFGRIYPPIPSL